MTKDQIAALKGMCDKALRGPWKHRIDNSWKEPDRIIELEHTCGDEENCYLNDGCEGGHVVFREELATTKRAHDEANWEFAAAARTALPSLIAERERMIAALKEACLDKCFCLLLEDEGGKCWACKGRLIIAEAEGQ